MTPGRASASSGDLRPKGIVGVDVIYGVFYCALVKFFYTHAHTHRVALGSAASHRNNYVSTTITTQAKHSVVLSLSSSLHLFVPLHSHNSHFISFHLFFRFLRMLLACVSNFYIFLFIFLFQLQFQFLSLLSFLLLSIFNFDCTFDSLSAKRENK